MTDLLTLSATALADRIRAGEISSVEAVEAHIAHAEHVNPTLNAIVADRFGEARAEAQAADQARAAGEDLAPLHGVPCTIKECFALDGMPLTAGLVSRKGYVSSSDATTVRRLRAAGAIPLGVTNLSELCMWMESNNRVYGRTNNPYDASRIVGGSSGGEGAIVGAGASPFGLGSDIGGSIRMPAFFNGVFGHKPTGGLVPGTGQWPNAEGDALRYLTTGPLCRRADDLMPLLRILSGPDGVDDGCREFTLGDPNDVDLRGLKVLNVMGNGFRRVSRDLLDAQQGAADALAARGALVEDVEIPALKRSFDLWSTLLSEAGEPGKFRYMLEGGEPKNLGWELVRWAMGRSHHTIPAIVLALTEEIAPKLAGDTSKIVADADALRADLVARLGDDGVMLYPSYTRPAPKHYGPVTTPLDWVYTAVLNVMELPTTQVPLGLNAKGLPLGVQVAATHGHDHMTIAVARALEDALGGWVPPTQWLPNT